MSGKGTAAGCESINVRRLNVIDSKALQLGAEIIDANEKDVLFGGEKGGGGDKESTQQFHQLRVDFALS